MIASALARAAIGVLVASTVLGCAGGDPPSPRPAYATNHCSRDADCAAGRCDRTLELCVADGDGAVRTLLLELTPPADDLSFGGQVYLQTYRIEDARAEGVHVNLEAPRRLTASFEYASRTCGSDLSDSTLPVRVTFVPSQAVLGLTNARRYVAVTGPIQEATRRYVFELLIPQGEYDVYVEPKASGRIYDAASPELGCAVVPHLFRRRTVGSTEFESLRQGELGSIDLLLPGDPDFIDWTVEVAHPVDGRPLSPRVRVSADSVLTGDTSSSFRIPLVHSQVVAGDYWLPGQELVRVRPPAGTARPEYLFIREALLALGGSQAPRIDPDPRTVLVQTWVEGGATPGGLGGVVDFVATDLSSLGEGINAAFRASAPITRGEVEVELLAGTYRMTTVPDDPTLSTVETEFVVRGAPRQAGRTTRIPIAPKLRGSVVTFDGLPLDAGRVQVVPSVLPSLHCTDFSDEPPQGCNLPPALREMLGFGAFRAATDGYSLGREGTFELSGLDCGPCQADAVGALYDVAVQPPRASAYPWLVQRNVELGAEDVDLGRLEIAPPVALAGRVTFGEEGHPLPGTAIRAFVYLDQDGQVVDSADPEHDLEWCASASTRGSRPARCLASLLQIAAVRADRDAAFSLVLPAALE